MHQKLIIYHDYTYYIKLDHYYKLNNPKQHLLHILLNYLIYYLKDNKIHYQYHHLKMNNLNYIFYKNNYLLNYYYHLFQIHIINNKYSFLLGIYNYFHQFKDYKTFYLKDNKLYLQEVYILVYILNIKELLRFNKGNNL